MSTFSSNVLDAMNGVTIYVRDTNNSQLLVHSFSWVETNLQMALRCYDTILICYKNKNT